MGRLISRSEMRRRSMTRDHRYSARADRACRRWTWVSLWPRLFFSEGALRSCLRHVAELLRLVGGELLGLLLPRDRAPAGGREEEVVDVAGRGLPRRERDGRPGRCPATPPWSARAPGTGGGPRR